MIRIIIIILLHHLPQYYSFLLVCPSSPQRPIKVSSSSNRRIVIPPLALLSLKRIESGGLKISSSLSSSSLSSSSSPVQEQRWSRSYRRATIFNRHARNNNDDDDDDDDDDDNDTNNDNGKFDNNLVQILDNDDRVDSNNSNNNNIENNNDNLSTFAKTLTFIKPTLPKSIQDSIIQTTKSIGFKSTNDLIFFASDFVPKQQQAQSNILIDDFQLNPLDAHRLRIALIKLVQYHYHHREKKVFDDDNDDEEKDGDSYEEYNNDKDHHDNDNDHNNNKNIEQEEAHSNNKPKPDTTKCKPPSFKKFIVNRNAKNRKTISKSSSVNDDNVIIVDSYGLSSNYQEQYPLLSFELDTFMNYMIDPSSTTIRNFYLVESPIRLATAEVYVRHVKLFLGWYLSISTQNNFKNNISTKKNTSLFEIFPTIKPSTSKPIVDFIKFLRKERNISNSYEANVLRGLTKLLKYIIANSQIDDVDDDDDNDNNHKNAENDTNNNFQNGIGTEKTFNSISTSSGNKKSFDEIPVIRELRRLQRDAGKKSKFDKRSSDESKKWLDWDEYLQVVEVLRMDVLSEIETYDNNTIRPPPKTKQQPKGKQQQQITKINRIK